MEEVTANLAWTAARRRLLEGLNRALQNLAAAGVRRVWIDGSFVTDRDEPEDVDGCWEASEWILEDVLDPVFWDDRPPRQAMKQKYGVDFLIALPGAGPKPSLQEFFMTDRDGRPKGLLLLELEREL